MINSGECCCETGGEESLARPDPDSLVSDPLTEWLAGCWLGAGWGYGKFKVHHATMGLHLETYRPKVIKHQTYGSLVQQI